MISGITPAQAAKELYGQRGEAMMMAGKFRKNSNLEENSGQENESRNRRNGATAERRQQAGDFGLLENAQRTINSNQSGVEGLRRIENQAGRQRIESEESAERRNSEDERALEELAKEQGEWLYEVLARMIGDRFVRKQKKTEPHSEFRFLFLR